MSGKKCQSWKFHDTNYEVRHNYCRNYEGKDVAPWCYVAGGKKEYCDIPKCALKSGELAFNFIAKDLSYHIFVFAMKIKLHKTRS